MKKSYIFLIAVLLFVFIWYLINSDDINKMNEIHKITQQKEHGLFSLNNKQQEKLDEYIKEILEIKVRGCSAGANIFFIKCGFIDDVGRYALGNGVYSVIINEINESKYVKYEHKPLFSEESTENVETEKEDTDRISQDFKNELNSIYSDRKNTIQKRQEEENLYVKNLVSPEK